ncbi:flagellar motor protein [Candidatus Photodesmus blepharus]|uniref:Flagellar motor protein n=1 Tax=Candidatus Photodesmus blepharonis TaxID=1179155 RepID=A0A084CPI1_9GAMM|nr:flagellar motor protein MotB [Candidatus Photodesmus blepharus]KEY91710.1 flagellar motor protein [Candidatus Photodesmus blepharus]
MGNETQRRRSIRVLPLWMATFADLMSLLMCFFVLLFSFSEMDTLKFKQIAGSMKSAFGAQHRLNTQELPNGNNISQEFWSGITDSSSIDLIMRRTTDVIQGTLRFHEGNEEIGNKLSLSQYVQNFVFQRQQAEVISRGIEENIKKVLEQEIIEGAIEVENLGQQIVIRIRERGAFPEGSAFLQPKFRPLIQKISDFVRDVPGIIHVSGHTDNQPLYSDLYRSNWDLSAQRAVSVAQEMEAQHRSLRYRLKIIGMADTDPLGPNDTELQRSENRRVEISVVQGTPIYSNDTVSVY